MSPPDTTDETEGPGTGLSFALDTYDGSDKTEDPDLTKGGSQPRALLTTARASGKWLRRQKKRNWLAEWAYYLANHRTNIGYTQYRPVNVSRPLTTVATSRVQLDCSSMVQWLYARGNAAFSKSGGMPDPSNYGHSGYGNTYSQEARGRKVDVPAKGDLAFYNGHVAIVVKLNKSNPRASTVVSHGSEIGPLILPANYRRDLHGFRRYI